MRRLLPISLLAAAALGVAPALAHEDHEQGPGPVVVAELEGPLDQRTLDFGRAIVGSPEAQVVVLHINSPGIASGDAGALFEAIRTASVPVAAWVGPQGATAYGGALQLLGVVDYAGAAPGTQLGYALPTVAGDHDTSLVSPTPDMLNLSGARVEVTEAGQLPDFLAASVPSIGQFIASLDGLVLDGVVIETASQTILADGREVIVPSVDVQFRKPGLFTRFLRLGIRPEAAFFFLTAGLALAAFEFYAAGVGVTAAVAALSLFLASAGLSALPTRWWAVAIAVLGVLLYTWDFQRNQLGLRSALGTALLLSGGLYLTDASPQFGPRSWVVVVVVAGVAMFYLFAMTTVVRSRFSTPTIGREYLIGRSGSAETGLNPDGLVEVDGARWRARAHRAAGIEPGDRVTVLAVRGIVLEVGPDSSSSNEGAFEGSRASEGPREVEN